MSRPIRAKLVSEFDELFNKMYKYGIRRCVLDEWKDYWIEKVDNRYDHPLGTHSDWRENDPQVAVFLTCRRPEEWALLIIEEMSRRNIEKDGKRNYEC